MNGIFRLATVLAAALVLAACGRNTASPGGVVEVAQGRVVYKVSADGKRLEAYAARNGVTPLGSIALPPGAIWSVANGADGRKVWIHGRNVVMLVDTRTWTEVARWNRDDGAPTRLAGPVAQ
ncbi:hypothetical protein G3580_04460 [Nitrogeniibacter mangrovi]|uniref:Lipoprotein n=1 Tax=Nitrogeniibacter mangrovi TaxID=2016596 RepID=A0A6C1B062_9RHOO|nr:hypothetical protein [Nitrogeniibacter mangrovi]QID16957.1 hypothetical protein G3580_04460 [Nitrogeniibacter mangrovi]